MIVVIILSKGFNSNTEGDGTMEDYSERSLFFKALSDPNRIMIVDMLSCGELCACTILEAFNLSQPTLSHHMKILCRSGLVRSRKNGKWTHYSIDQKRFSDMNEFIRKLTSEDGKERIYDKSC